MSLPKEIRSGTALWAGAAFFVVAAHAVAAAYLLAPAAVRLDDSAPSGTLVVELAADVFDRSERTIVPVGSDQARSNASSDNRAARQPIEKSDKPPSPSPPDDKPLEVPHADLAELVEQPRQASRPQTAAADSVASAANAATSAARIEAQRARDRAAAPTVGTGAKSDPRARAMWNDQVFRQLERNKRYPHGASNRREAGTVVVRFTIDPRGRVLASTVAEGSGYAALDAEALDLVGRAQPYPIPPEAFGNADVVVEVPIRFNMP